jgi:hypothetical protein
MMRKENEHVVRKEGDERSFGDRVTVRKRV